MSALNRLNADPEVPPDDSLALLERVAHALRIDLVVLDAEHRRRLVVNRGSALFASPEAIARLAKRLGPSLDAAGVAIAHADPFVLNGAEICAFRALDGLVLVATGPAHPRAPSPEGLIQLYGLTPAEARVAHLLALELSPTEIAEALDVELCTVRTHLKMIRSKLDAESQTDLVRRLLHSAAVLHPD
jgi:DNA-binding CsgD family transcriptional regulator